MKTKTPRPFDPDEKLDRVAVGRAVRLFREFRGLSQMALATVAGISQTAISNLERGETFSDDSLNKAAEGLNVSVRELFEVSFEIQKPDSAIHESMAPFDEMKRLFQEGFSEEEVPASARPFRPEGELEATALIPAGTAEDTITRVVKRVARGPIVGRKPTHHA